MAKSDDYIEEELKKNKGELDNLEKKAQDKLQKNKENKTKLTEKIKEVLLYVGFLFSIIGGFSYIVITVVLVTGFEANLELENQIVFSVISALIGLSISFALRNQGIAFAKKEPKSQVVMKKYYEVINKTKKPKELHDIKHYLIRATIIDFFIKGIIVGVMIWFMISIFIGGSKNYGLIGLAFANLLLFTGFGLIALSSAYDKYVDEHIPVISQRTERLEKQIIEEINTTEQQE